MQTYFIELTNGYCTLLKARHVGEARHVAEYYNGKENVKSVREATQGDIEWICAMGGSVP